MKKGIVEFFNNGKLYGRIHVKGQLYHLGMSDIRPDGTGFKSVDPGEEVTFEPVPPAYRRGANTLPSAKKVMRSVVRDQLPKGLESQSEPLDVIELRVFSDGRVYLPKREKEDLRDYASGAVRAYYVGSPACIMEETRIAVDMPEEVKDGTFIVPVNDDGGILQRGEWTNNFPWGGFLVVVKMASYGKSCVATTKKLFVRTQDPINVVDERDHGVWVGVQDSYRLELTIPEKYTDERDLMAKLEPQIPDPYGWSKKKPAASARKFARAVARAVTMFAKYDVC